MNAMTLGSLPSNEMLDPARLAQMCPTDSLLTPLADTLESAANLHGALQAYCIASDTLEFASGLAKGKIGSAFKGALGLAEELTGALGASQIMGAADDPQFEQEEDFDFDNDMGLSPSPSPSM